MANYLEKEKGIDLTSHLNQIMIDSNYNLFQFMKNCNYVNNSNANIIKTVSDNCKLVLQNYIMNKETTDYINYYSHAIAFYIPKINEIHLSFTSDSIKKITDIISYFKLNIEIQKLVLNVIYHETLHAYFNINNINILINTDERLFNIYDKILNYKTNKPNYINLINTFKQYEIIQPITYIEELITWSFTIPLVNELMISIDIRISKEFKDILKSYNLLQTNTDNVKKENNFNYNYFELNPTKILGNIEKRKNQYGEMQDYVIGDINSEIDKIDANIPEVNYYDANDFQQNVTNVNIEVDVNNAINNIEKNIVQHEIRKKNKKILQQKAERSETINKNASIVTFKESSDIYNKHISRKELEAYLIANPNLDYHLFIDNFSFKETELIDSSIDMFVQCGDGNSLNINCNLLYYLDDKLQYYATFLNGNIYEKIKKTKLQKDNITLKFSETFYNKQLDDLNKITPKTKTITDEVFENRPIILPYTAFCLNHVIKELRTGETLSMPIISAFLWWCRSSYYSSVKYNGATYYDIETYVNNGTFTKASKDATKEEKQRVDEKNSELYQFAKTNGDRAFSDFLANYLNDSDVIAVNKYYNERFNNYVYPNLSKIPVGFTYSKYFKNGSPLIFSETQRNSVAFMNIHGSGLLGYDVGVGKTLSAIINISHSIDTKRCHKPLLIVPNATYYKWIAEIQNTEYLNKKTGLKEVSIGAIPHLGNVNSFYNLNNDLIINELKEYTEDEHYLMQEIKSDIANLKDITKKYEKNSDNYNKYKLNNEKAVEILNNSVFKYATHIKDIITELGYGSINDLANQLLDVKETNPFKKYLDVINLTASKLILCNEYTLNSIIVTSGKWKEIQDNTITICTYEGFRRMGFSKSTQEEMSKDLVSILSQGQNFYKEVRGYKVLDEKKVAKFNLKIQKAIGQSIRDSRVEIDTLGFDYIVIDEVHNAKKVFTLVESAEKDNNYDFEKKSRYKLVAGESSVLALKAFCLTHYIQKNNKGRNVCLLSATPFTNSPLEIYSILSLTNHKLIKDNGFEGLQEFFDYYIKTEYKMIFNSKNQPQKKEEVVGFNNLYSLRSLIYSVVDYKTGDEIKIQRPCKISLPIKDTAIICQNTSQEVKLPTIETIVTPTDLQKKYLLDIENYITNDNVNKDILDLGNTKIEEDGDIAKDDTLETDEDNKGIDDDYNKDIVFSVEEEDDYIRIMKGLSFMRAVTLSPYLFKPANMGKPTPKQLIDTSPKLKYVVDCIASLKRERENKGLEVQGIIIYCNLGTNEKSFGFSLVKLLKEYMESSDYIARYKEGEVQLLISKTTKPQREIIKADFNSGRVKVIIGSATIKEGIDLQNKTIGLFNLTVDWNPTDAKQIEGRCWRQGNENAYVFINYVLVADSSDIVYFQKLQDKTSRIKEIWDRTGVKSQLDLNDFDPNRIKLDLLTRADKIAKIEIEIDSDKLNRDSKILLAQIEELRNAKTEISGFSDSKPKMIKALTEIQDIIVNYRRNERLETRDNKIKALKIKYSELDFNDTIDENNKLKEKSKIMSEIKSINSNEFILETNEMYKADKDYNTLSNEELSNEIKNIADRLAWGGTYYRYYEENKLPSLSPYFELFNLSKQSPAYYFRNYWKRADFYESTYLKANNLTIDQLDEKIEQVVTQYNGISDNITAIRDSYNMRIETIKERIRKKQSLYKTVNGRVEEFKSLFHLFEFRSGYGIAKDNNLISNTNELETEQEAKISITNSYNDVIDLYNEMLSNEKDKNKIMEYKDIIEVYKEMLNK